MTTPTQPSPFPPAPSYIPTPRVDAALDTLDRVPALVLATHVDAPGEPWIKTLSVQAASLLTCVRDELCELARWQEEFTAADLDCIAAEAADAHPDVDGGYLMALRLMGRLRALIEAARAEECALCGGSGEADVEYEDAAGRALSYPVACPCGGE